MLVRAFQSGHVTSSTPTAVGRGVTGGSGPGPLRPPPPSPNMRLKPLPPNKAKVSPMAPPPKVRLRDPSQPAVLLKKPHGNGEVGQKGGEVSGKPRMPMLPRTAQGKGSTPLPAKQNKHSVTGFSNKSTSPTRSARVKVHSQCVNEPSEGGGGVASRIQIFQNKSVSKDWHGATNSSGWSGHAADHRTRSGSTGSQTSPSPNHSNHGSPSKTKKPLIPVKLLTSPEERDEEEREMEKGREMVREREKKEKERRGNDRQPHEGGVVTKKLSPHVPLSHVPYPTPSLHTHTSHTRSQSHVHNVSPYASSSVAMASTNQSADVIDGGEYENVVVKPLPDASSGRGHQQAPPHQQPTSYENVFIKPSPKAQLGHAPLRPRPYQPPSSRLVKRSSSLDNYENVDFSPLSLQLSQHHGPAPPPSTAAPLPRPSHSEERVLDDDDTLFGKEGPPGLKREEVIYENFGPDDGNKYMSVEQMETHISKKEKKGLSAEYLRIKNEPLCGSYKACRSVM